MTLPLKLRIMIGGLRAAHISEEWAAGPDHICPLNVFRNTQYAINRSTRGEMLKIRLRRMGAIRQPHYRVVVADARAPRDGAFIENLGHYNPLTDPATIQIDVAKYEEWRKKGAQPTDAVASLVKLYNRTHRKATAAGDAAEPAKSSGKTRTASGKRAEPKAEATAEVTESPEASAATEDAPMNEALAEATRDDGEGSEALTGGAGDGAEESDAAIGEAAETGGSANTGAATEESSESAG